MHAYMWSGSTRMIKLSVCCLMPHGEVTDQIVKGEAGPEWKRSRPQVGDYKKENVEEVCKWKGDINRISKRGAKSNKGFRYCPPGLFSRTIQFVPRCSGSVYHSSTFTLLIPLIMLSLRVRQSSSTGVYIYAFLCLFACVCVCVIEDYVSDYCIMYS